MLNQRRQREPSVESKTESERHCSIESDVAERHCVESEEAERHIVLNQRRQKTLILR